ncbi:hypothetical protein AAG906_003069 [Vitis piasezkii]
MTTRRPNPKVIHFTIDGRHGILGARHIAEALHIPYEPMSPADFREKELPPDAPYRCGVALTYFHSSIWCDERSYIGGIISDIEGFYFDPHHLIMTSLLHFEEKAHTKKLQRAMLFHYFFLCCFVRY